MFYEFASDLSLDEVSAVIAEHNSNLGVEAFLRIDKGDYIVFNYVINFDGSFPPISKDDPVLARKQAIIRECRGLTFSRVTGKVLARKYCKFFNVGQKEETQPHAIDWSQPHVIMEKLDGSMLTPFRPDRSESIRWATKMGLTDVALPVEEFVRHNQRYDALAWRCEGEGITPIFEWCSRKQRIVIDYPEDMLVLTALRDNRSGSFLSYDRMVALGKLFGIPVVGVRPGSVDDIEQLMKETADLIDEEGYVIRFNNGHMVKLKAREYCLIHGTKDTLAREKDVLQAIFGDVIDDVIPFMDVEDRKRIERFVDDMEHAIAAIADRMTEKTEQYKLLCGGSKKTFALSYAQNFEGQFDKSLCFSIWDGRRAVDCIKKIIAANLGSSTKIAMTRYLFGNLRWDNYRDTTVVLDD